MAESGWDDDAITVKRVAAQTKPTTPAPAARPLRTSGPMQPPPGATPAPQPPAQAPTPAPRVADAQRPTQATPTPPSQPRVSPALGGFIMRQAGQAQASNAPQPTPIPIALLPQPLPRQPFYPPTPQSPQPPAWSPMPPAQPAQPLPVAQAHHVPAQPQSVAGFLRLSPTQFEEYVAQLLRADGHRHVQRTGGAGDLNADITCTTPRGEYMVVQCKRFKPGKTVGTPVVQTFIGMVQVHHHAQASMVVTTSTFTKQAKTLARQHNVTLVNGEQLIQWANRVSRGNRLQRP